MNSCYNVFKLVTIKQHNKAKNLISVHAIIDKKNVNSPLEKGGGGSGIGGGRLQFLLCFISKTKISYENSLY